MANTFNIPFTGNAAAHLQRARDAAQKAGIQFTGDEKQGTFAGMGVKGSYQTEGNAVQVTINEKPFVISWQMLETQLRSFFK